MYKTPKFERTSIKANKTVKGEYIHEKVMRIRLNKEPIQDGVELTYTERKDGVKPEYNIRTDRAEVVHDITDKISKGHRAKREERHAPKTTDKPKDGGAEPIQTTT